MSFKEDPSLLLINLHICTYLIGGFKSLLYHVTHRSRHLISFYIRSNLNANNIKFIENETFDNLTDLVELRLNKNNLTQVKDMFTSLGKLRIL